MADVTDDSVARRLRETIALSDFGLDMLRQRLRRKFPNASEAEIDQRFHDELALKLAEPMPGVPVAWPRSTK